MDASFNMMKAAQNYWSGVFQYTRNFMAPSWNVMESMAHRESMKIMEAPLSDTIMDFIELLKFNMKLAGKGYAGSIGVMNDYYYRQMREAFTAAVNTIDGGGEDIAKYIERKAQLIDLVVNTYPKAIRDIRREYGLHLDSGGYVKVAETNRFEIYQVLPLRKDVEVRRNAKPILMIPPHVLGPNILAFLPGEGRSYAHNFADQGIPTYVRVVKDIDTNVAVQLMTGEDDARDVRYFCERIMARHGKPVTLNGLCQGGFLAVLDLLSGELDGLVDALITCVAPLDGSRSKGLIDFIELLPPRFRDLGYAVKTLSNGNQVVDGKVLSWVYKLKSIEREAPLFSLYRDLMMFDRGPGKAPEISKTAAAINYWILYDQKDLPIEVTKLSFASFLDPVESDGTLPVKLFGRKLNFKRIQEKGIKWLICVADKDDLVDGRSSLSPLDYVDAELTVYPKGHVSIFTSWSQPKSEWALHKSYIAQPTSPVKSSRLKGNSRGPVRFHLDLDESYFENSPLSDDIAA